MELVIGAGKVAAHGSRGGSEVDRRSEGTKDALFGQVAVRMARREGIPDRVADVEPTAVEGEIRADGRRQAPALHLAEVDKVHSLRINGGDVKEAETLLASLDLVSAALGLCEVVLQLLIDGLVKDLKAVCLKNELPLVIRVNENMGFRIALESASTTYIVVWKVNVRLLLDDRVKPTIDNAEGIQVKVVGVLILNCAVGDLLILLLKEPHEARAVVASIALGPDADAIVTGLVIRELREPGLGKMPQGVGSLGGAVGCVCRLLAAKGANHGGQVELGQLGREVGGLKAEAVVREVGRAVGGRVVGKANLVGLVNVQHIDLIVPAPRIQHRRLGIFIHEARAVFHQQAQHGRGPWPSIEPNGKWSGGRVLAGFKEPKEPEHGNET